VLDEEFGLRVTEVLVAEGAAPKPAAHAPEAPTTAPVAHPAV
jgi:hypothetical protein